MQASPTVSVSSSKSLERGTTQSSPPGSGLREFETTSQLAEISNYTEVTKSCASAPEHVITYINEAVGPLSDRDVGENDNAGAPTYPFTMMGLALRSSNAIDDVEQLNVWLRNGVSTRLNAESDNGSQAWTVQPLR